MAYKNLRQFIDFLKARNELEVISAEVSPLLEITEINNRIVQGEGPALFFERVQGSPFPLLINTFGSKSRMLGALGVSSYDEITQRMQEFTELKSPDSFMDKLKMLPRLFDLSQAAPKKVSVGPCQEVVITEGPMLDLLPVIQCWPKDAGKFITLPLVITRDPVSGHRNVGVYRMQVFDNRTTAMHWQIHKDGADHFRKLAGSGKSKLEVAVVIGADPATMYAGTAPLPKDMDEFLLAGFLRKEPVPLVRCKTVDLEVPAEAEIVLEGYVDMNDLKMEGPFGDHTGYYSPAKEFPVFHVTCMTHRKNPVYITTVVGKPPMEDCYLGKATERIFLPFIRKMIPEIVDIHLPWEGVFHNCILVSVQKSYPFQARKVMNAIWGLGQMMFSKFIFVFDADTNVQDLREVAFKAFSHTDPKRDLVIAEGPVDELDHCASQHLWGSKMGVDCTSKLPEEGMQRAWPEEMRMSEAIQEMVTKRWEEYGLHSRQSSVISREQADDPRLTTPSKLLAGKHD
ncbi:MAG: menaquinone biosynthesis decarboxylase [Candidatus Omnitrophica bacterium]|nr:menaquinone biosynthesis decarboxylase [Candidatus Omnitrophota bacterium]